MIYQLAQLNWRGTLLGMLFFELVLGGLAFANFIFMSYNRPLSASLPTVILNLLLLGGASGVARCRATPFQAALPIPARDLFMYRLVSLQALVWIPLLAAAGAGYLVMGRASSLFALWLIAAGAVSTAWALALFSVRLRELSAPPVLSGKLLLTTALLASFALTGAMVFSVRPGIVLLVCAGAIAVFLRRDLAVMPKAFVVAPAEAVAWRSSRQANSSPRQVWRLVCRSIFAWGPSANLIISVVGLLNPVFSIVASVFLTSFVSEVGSSMSWMWALPVSRRKVLALALIPPLVLEAAVQAAKPAGFIQAMELVAVTLLCTSSVLAMNNRNRLRAGSRFIAVGSPVVCACIPTALGVADILLGGSLHVKKHIWGSYTAEYLAAHLARIPLPLLLIVVAGTFTGLGALYWLAQKQFEAADFLPTPQIRLDAVESSSGIGA